MSANTITLLVLFAFNAYIIFVFGKLVDHLYRPSSLVTIFVFFAFFAVEVAAVLDWKQPIESLVISILMGVTIAAIYLMRKRLLAT